MALVTTCPHCQTSFRVVADQLKLRRGLVRCGRCRTVFSGLEQLRRIDEGPAPLPADAPPAHPAPAAAPLDSVSVPGLAADPDTDDTGLLSAQVAPAHAAREFELGDEPDSDHLATASRHSEGPAPLEPPAFGVFRTPPERQAAGRGMSGPAGRPGDDDFAEELEAVAEELAAVAEELDTWDDGESAIDYFSAEHQRRGLIGRNGGWKLLAAAALVVLLGLQATLANRDWLSARYPALTPAVSALAAPFGLTVALPQALHALAIESFELQATAQPGRLSVSALLHNQATHSVRWPSMLLTLTGPDNRVLLRKAIDPTDHLSEAVAAAGLRPRSERPIRMILEAGDLQPAGYSVELFYR